MTQEPSLDSQGYPLKYIVHNETLVVMFLLKNVTDYECALRGLSRKRVLTINFKKLK